MKTPKPRRTRREGLVYGHLERVSRDLLKEHFATVQRYVGKGSGIYALYRKDRLIYVGLASALSGRVRAHLRDRHKETWDQFSIYLTVRDQHIKELESLLLRIAKPESNVQGGKLFGSRDLKSKVQQAIRQQYKQEMAGLFARSSRAAKALPKANKEEKEKVLQLFPEGARVRATNHTKSFRAVIRRDGQIRFDGKLYGSLSAAAKAAIGRSVNGWWFWQVERGKNNWIRLREARRAGIPIYRRK
ncbi:MAG: DUF2924 domain-containing protein [Reyranella sp.]|uniref:restriction system modified-DNA reader domain-containing protein n=1 Tax=Reyranella sp. TaxID=1929291 RepID=UPI001223B2C2|nr:DUF2924 domain-containing protein [Reyranella sp.]TAJ86347.1 MAG: DUF2924 domain-containing protein [Reyranella sp.]TBR22198.1 MAG: DUF2924 domain-containing protein [Reyranella sp.]